MRNISEIYQDYHLMNNLKDHMFRVTAVASLICDSISVPVNKENIITAALLHDMANIIKFKLEYFPEFNKPEGLEYWQKVKDEYIEKYGPDEHKATIAIMKELNMKDDIIYLVDNIRFSLFCDQVSIDNLDLKIIHYADARVGPKGILSYIERMEEGHKRYKGHKNSVSEENYLKLVNCGQEIEKQIFTYCSIKPEDINDESVKPVIEKLRNFII